jgi:adenosylcobinamide-GDP ribazoletransferase
MIKKFKLKEINKIYKDITLDFLSCLIFFTIIPIKIKPKKLADSIYTIPLVSLFIGALVALPVILLSLFKQIDLLNSILIIISSSIISGCLHEDGLADFSDAFGGNTQKRRLEIMNDSNIGTYGTLAIVFSVLIRFILIFFLFSSQSISDVLLIIISVSVLSRISMLYILSTLPAAKKTGLGKGAKQLNESKIFLSYIATIIITLFILVIFINLKVFIASIFALIAACLIVSFIAWKKIRGQTGDVCGAVQQVSEILIYLFICLVI